MPGAVNMAGSYVGAAIGKKLASPIADFSRFYGLVTSYYDLVKKRDATKLKSQIDTANSNEYTRQNYAEVIRGRDDPQMSTDWVAAVLGKGTDPTVNIPWFYIDTLNTPSLSFETDGVFRDGTMKNFAGGFSVQGGLTLGLYTDISAKSVSQATQWFSDVMDAKMRTYSLPSDYKRNVKLYLHDPRRRIVLEVTYFGCFPTSISGWQMDNASSSPLVTTVELSVDYVSVGKATP